MIYKRSSSQKIKENEKNNITFYKNNQKRESNILFLSRNKNNESPVRNRPSTAKYYYNHDNSLNFSKSVLNFSPIRKKPTTPSTACSMGSHPTSGTIFKKLKQRDQIEKIIQEESKKIYFKQRINYGHHLSVEEFRRRFKNPIPQNTYKRNLQRRLKEKLKTKSFFKPTKYLKKPEKNIELIDDNKTNLSIINANKKLIRNYSAFSSVREITVSKKNELLVNDYFKKSENEKRKKTQEIIRQFDMNKKGKCYNQFSRNNKHKKILQKFNEIEFNKFRSFYSSQNKKKLKEKAKVFDTIIIDELNSNLEKIKSIKDETHNTNQINYVALTNKIFSSNLIKQMRLIYIRDPTMNILRGKTTKKISDLKRETPLYYEFEQLYNQDETDITISRYNKIKLSLPKFIKTKFKKSTNSKYGNIIDNYFGIPV